jgi:hypothetical protein
VCTRDAGVDFTIEVKRCKCECEVVVFYVVIIAIINHKMSFDLTLSLDQLQMDDHEPEFS